MPDLTKEMTDSEIKKLDYFDKAQLYHNVYMNYTYSKLPASLKVFYTDDEGLQIVKAVISNANIKNPYEIAKLIKALNPAKPQTLQEIYARAAYLANVCDTSIEKVLKSDIFNIKDFIPALTENAIKITLANKTTGSLVVLKAEDYIPAQDDSGSDTPTPVPINGDYTTEKKIYFVKENGIITCATTFANVIAEVPKLPAAELLLGAGADSQNILNISCDYNELRNVVNFNFIRIYDSTIEFFTIHYSPESISYETNELKIYGGDINIE